MQIKKMVKKVSVGLMSTLAVCAVLSTTVGAVVNNSNICVVESNNWQDWPQGPEISSGIGILMNAATGEILYSKGIDDQRYPASITKIMTALVALENSTPDTLVTFTETGMADAYSGSSNIIPKLGETFTMEQCIYMIMLKSANDVSTQVAEVVGGDVENFVAMMNQIAIELGCNNTHFKKASGLPDENHYTSAYDMALIAQAAMKNETFRQVVGTKNYVVPASNLSGARSYDNHHQMLLDGEWHYEGCIGGKTGYTDSSRNTLVTYAQRGKLELISVVMYGNGGGVVLTDSIALMDYGFNNFTVDAEGLLKTTDGKYIYENQLLTEEEYQEVTATPIPTPETAEDDLNNKENTSVQKEKFGARDIAYIVIGVLVFLILVGILLMFIGIRLEKKRRRRRRMARRRAEQRRLETMEEQRPERREKR